MVAVEYATQVAQGLAAAHAKGIQLTTDGTKVNTEWKAQLDDIAGHLKRIEADRLRRQLELVSSGRATGARAPKGEVTIPSRG
jgi:hypothetical protein